MTGIKFVLRNLLHCHKLQGGKLSNLVGKFYLLYTTTGSDE